MELRQLESLLAVAEELHFGRAAERLHLSQPALSQQIKRLEQELGFELFSRTNRRVTLTAAGRVMYVHAQRLLDDAAAMVVEGARVARGQAGSLRVGYVGAALHGPVPRIVQNLRAASPGIALSLLERKTAEQLTLLAQDRLDLGFIHLPDGPLPGYEVLTLDTERVGIALPIGHPLTARETLALKELAGEPFILFPRDLEPDTHDRFTAACLAAGFMPEIAQEATGLQTLLGLVATGLGVAFITETVAGGLGPGVTFRPLHPNPPTLTNAIVWRTGHHNPSIDVFTAIAHSR